MGHQGPNHTGHQVICIGCQQRCSSLMPDNTEPVPICLECWGQMTVPERIKAFAELKHANRLGMAINKLHEWMESQAAERKMFGSGRNSQN